MSGSEPVLPLQTRLGNFELVRLLAQGGMADIYLARHLGLDRHVAIKVLNSRRARDAEARALFLDEARLLAMLHHHNVATVFEVDIDIDRDTHYLAMEYVDGADLREMLAAASRAELAIAYDTAIAIVAQAASGLDHAHRRCGSDSRPLHLVHRDVSLSNIMVARDGAVKVVDFGIATATVSAHVTNPGVVRGKSSYMSPEQCLGDPVDLRTDVFALGVVLYEMTTGRRCFPGNTDFERMLAVVRGEYVPARTIDEDFPEDLERVIQTALALDPAERYASAAALAEALEQVARAHGWMVGATPIVRTMDELFPEPALDDDTELTPEPVLVPLPLPTVVITRPRRLARGTDAAECVADDDEPTRGRRSVPRMWGPPLAA
jgi:serine/threonine-protein kinase